MKETINVPKSISWAINYILLIYFLFIAWFTVIKKKDIDVDFYPNPFEESITFSMEIPYSAIFSIEIYNYTGYVVTKLTSGYYEDDVYKMIWDASTFENGVYFFRAKSNGLVVDKGTIIKL